MGVEVVPTGPATDGELRAAPVESTSNRPVTGAARGGAVAGPARRRFPGLTRRWAWALILGELVGFVPPAVTGAVVASAGLAQGWLVVALTLAGTLEGAAIGTAQARVLASCAPSVRGRDWVVATATAAGFAWFVGMGGGALLGSAGPSPVLLAALVPAWVAALLGMGYLQWRVLRAAVPRSGRWVPVNAGAWLVGVLVPVAALSSVPNGWPVVAHVVAGVLGAVAMGAVVGVLTGRALEGLLARGG